MQVNPNGNHAMPDPGPNAICGDSRYMWNLSIYRDVIAQNIPAYWCTPLI